MKPHKCPVCQGDGKLPDRLPVTTAGPQFKPCHPCSGTGIVWEPAATIPYAPPSDGWTIGNDPTNQPSWYGGVPFSNEPVRLTNQ